MPTKIRLQRKGKKRRPFYHLVVADGRAPRDGKFIERLGTYDPVPTPATIDLNFDRALHWIQVGAQPTETARSILSHKGVMLKHHLLKGVKKGALTEEEAEKKFQNWLEEKEAKTKKIISEQELSEKEKQKKIYEEEKKISEARAETIAKRKEEEQVKEEAKEEKPKAEEKKEETPKAEEKKEETPKAEEKKEETPKTEEKKEDAPKTEEKEKEKPEAEDKQKDSSEAEEKKEDTNKEDK